ncbi:MAG: GNAT family N-acetyltransferase [Acidimicrobiales bacterium]
MTEPSVRTLREDEKVEASRVVNYGMLGSISDDVSQGWAEIMEADRAFGAFSAEGRLVGLARHFASELRVPGGEVAAAGVTAVAVLPTHRRQGHLDRMMRAQLRAIADEQTPVALLVAAEWEIYGRYGYGPAIDACGFEIDAGTARFRTPATGAIELVLPDVLRPSLEACHEERRARTPGAIRREPAAWDVFAGVRPQPGQPPDAGQRRGAVWRDDAGVVAGAVAYEVDGGWHRNRPAATADVTLLVGATPEAERELWRHLCEIDWVRTVRAGNRAVDDPLPFLLGDGRAAVAVDRFDCIWARILDLPGAFRDHRRAVGDAVVVEVVDPLGYAAGRWRLELGPDGSEVTGTSASAEVTLPIGTLGAAFLGGKPVRRLNEAGWLDEERPGGADRLGALLATPSAPWSPTTY